MLHTFEAVHGIIVPGALDVITLAAFSCYRLLTPDYIPWGVGGFSTPVVVVVVVVWCVGVVFVIAADPETNHETADTR